jgi:hypothetical protein
VRRSLIRKGQTLRLVPLSASLWFLLGRYDQGTGSIARTLSNVESIIRVRVHVLGIRIWSHPGGVTGDEHAQPGEAALQSVAASLYEEECLVRAAKIQNTPTHPPKNVSELL